MVPMSSRMGLIASKPNHIESPPNSIPYSAAGILFCNDTHVLAGYQPHKQTPCMTGIGGSREDGEVALYTAWREATEELLDCQNVPAKFIDECIQKFVPTEQFSRGDYICYAYSFTTLEEFLRLAKRHRIVSAVYTTHPTTLLELLFTRKNSSTAEVASLCYLPFLRQVNGPLFVHEEFSMDMEQLAFHQSTSCLNDP